MFGRTRRQFHGIFLPHQVRSQNAVNASLMRAGRRLLAGWSVAMACRPARPTVYAATACEAKEQKIELAGAPPPFCRPRSMPGRVRRKNSFLIDSALSRLDVSVRASAVPMLTLVSA